MHNVYCGITYNYNSQGVEELLVSINTQIKKISVCVCMYVCVYVCVCVCVHVCAQLCLALCNSIDCSPPDSSVHGIFQTRILEWVAISYSRGSS